MEEIEKSLVAEVRDDFRTRQAQRRAYDAQWRLNLNYLTGKQYCDMTANGDIKTQEKLFDWQQQEAFNHIATIIESRHSKLLKIRPRLNVFPASNDPSDVKTAETCKKILDSVCNTEDMSKVISDTTRWSETCGTAFYKIIWNSSAGRTITTNPSQVVQNASENDTFRHSSTSFDINLQNSTNADNVLQNASENDMARQNAEEFDNNRQNASESDSIQHNSTTNASFVQNAIFNTGDVQVICVPPFEIYPETSAVENVEDLRSIIHARAYHVDEIKSTWGVDVEGEDVDIFMLNGFVPGQGMENLTGKRNYAVVLEKYEAPSAHFPNGRLIIVAGDKLLYFGELPYMNGTSGKRGFPFVKQTSCSGIGCFWGTSIIERLIPVQRAYNSVKNRKAEHLARASIGVLAVEDGSVDVDNLEEDGLCPGKVLVYRQGANLPEFLEGESEPFDFFEEEKTLLDEFSSISGVSDMFFDNYLSKQISGNALELMIEQDESRMLATIDNARSAVKLVGKHILRLYRQFAGVPMLARIVGDSGNMEVFYFSRSDISSDDVTIDVRNDVYDSYVQKKQLVLELLDRGVFDGPDGKILPAMRLKIAELVGLSDWMEIL